MKPKLALIGIVSLALAACDKSEKISETAKPEVPKKKAFGSEPRTTGFKPVASKPKPATESTIAGAPDTGRGEISSPPATTPRPSPAIPSASAQATEKLRQERLARMAKAREERVAQATTQLATRYKEQDVNGDGFLAKDEVDGRMQRRFAEADKNADGFLDATEQASMIQAAAERMGNGGGQRRGGQNGGRGRQNPNP